MVSVILLNFNGARFAPLWSSFFLERYPRREILFVDNGSSDDSIERFLAVAGRNPELPSRVVRIPTNVGYAQGNNVGVREARGELLALVNNDVETSGSWIRPMVEAFEEEPRLGVAQSRLLDLFHRDRPDPGLLGGMDLWGFGQLVDRAPATGTRSDIFYADGASLFLRRRAVEELGWLFPQEFHFLGEDLDLSWRARLCGWKVQVVHGSVAWHARGGTVAGVVTKRSPEALANMTRNRLATVASNYGTARVLLLLPMCMALALGRAVLLSLAGDRTHAQAVLQGIYLFLQSAPIVGRRRREVQRRRTRSDHEALEGVLGPAESLRALRSRWREARRELADDYAGRGPRAI